MEATCSYETSIDFQRATQRYIPEDRNLGNNFAFIRDVPYLHFGRDTDISDKYFVVFLRQMSRYYFKLRHNQFLPHVLKSIIYRHPII
jgi:hypothetical protein